MHKHRWLIVIVLAVALVAATGLTMAWVYHQRQASKIVARPVPQAQVGKHAQALIKKT
ncbi:serine-type D-Ala-D-Ala carboxypeptidase, partial [Lacticaseibacillus paracasei subsp. paracasei CNCM I-2877]